VDDAEGVDGMLRGYFMGMLRVFGGDLGGVWGCVGGVRGGCFGGIEGVSRGCGSGTLGQRRFQSLEFRV